MSCFKEKNFLKNKKNVFFVLNCLYHKKALFLFIFFKHVFYHFYQILSKFLYLRTDRPGFVIT